MNVAFIGLGNMGGPMAINLVKEGHNILGFDLMAENADKAKEGGVSLAASAEEAVATADAVVTMLPNGRSFFLYLINCLIRHPKAQCLLIARPLMWQARAKHTQRPKMPAC